MARKRKNTTHWRFDNSQSGHQLYYSIGEVARMFRVDETQLRYWERHTPLAPKRSATSGSRLYTQDDLKMVERIRYLLVDKGLSLQAISTEMLTGEKLNKDLEMREKLLQARDKVECLRKIVIEQLQTIKDPMSDPMSDPNE